MEKDVPYCVECSFQNTLLELQTRLGYGKDVSGYTLRAHGSKYIVVNDGGDRDNAAFYQSITVLSGDNCTTGTVFITA